MVPTTEPSSSTATPRTEPPGPVAADRAFIGTLSAIAAVLATRALLLLAVIGTFALAALSIRAPSVPAIVLVGVFGLLTIGPLAYLDVRRGAR